MEAKAFPPSKRRASLRGSRPSFLRGSGSARDGWLSRCGVRSPRDILCNFSRELSRFGTSKGPTLINFSSRQSGGAKKPLGASDLTRGFARAFVLTSESWNFGTAKVGQVARESLGSYSLPGRPSSNRDKSTARTAVWNHNRIFRAFCNPDAQALQPLRNSQIALCPLWGVCEFGD